MSYILAGLLQTFFWLAALSIALWLVRRFAPSLETPFFKVGVAEGVRILIRRIRSRLQALPPAPRDP
jgi:hypothetical protein